MPTRTSVKTRALGGRLNGKVILATTVPDDGVHDEWQTQEDIRLIGASVMIFPEILDVHVNADGALYLKAEITRAGVQERDGGIVACAVTSAWTAAVVSQGTLMGLETVMFPAGLGIDVFNGDSINLAGRLFWIGAGGNITIYVSGILYYIER